MVPVSTQAVNVVAMTSDTSQKVVEYTVVSGKQMEIDDIVQARIIEGWQPLGGISVSSGAMFSQAMVKYAPTSKEEGKT